jgi:5-methylcytosine-specific restriction protein B
MCDVAEKSAGKLCVLVIDELSRSDPGRVFGEALTYIEMTKRRQLFHVSSGRPVSIPDNLVFLATMNPMDRGVDEVDAALERRFAKIAMDPDPVKLNQFLTTNGMAEDLRKRLVTFFNYVFKSNNVYSRIGHAYFYSVKDEEGLQRLWDHQLRFHFEKAFRLNDEGLADVGRQWQRVLAVRHKAGAAEPIEEAVVSADGNEVNVASAGDAEGEPPA